MISRLSDKLYFIGITAFYAILIGATELALKGTLINAAPTVKNTLLLLVILQSALFLMLLLVERQRLLQRADDILWMTLLVASAGAFFITLFRIDYSNRVLITGLVYLLILLVIHARKAQSFSYENVYLFETVHLADLEMEKPVQHITADKIDSLPEGIKCIIPDRLDDATLLSLIRATRHKNIQLIQRQDFIENMTGRLTVETISIIDLTDALDKGFFALVKRLFDIIISLALLGLLSPLMLLTILVIRLESSGAAIYSQKRVGQGGTPFTIYKFRSMTEAAKNASSAFATEDEFRITRIGAFIRRSRIDEIPQLWNVLRGDMSLVGPRPEQVSFVEQFLDQIPSYGLRHLVRPGITGWAQVMQGYAADTESTAEKLSYDLFYIKHSGLTMDLLIIIRTIKTILTGFGSR